MTRWVQGSSYLHYKTSNFYSFKDITWCEYSLCMARLNCLIIQIILLLGLISIHSSTCLMECVKIMEKEYHCITISDAVYVSLVSSLTWAYFLSLAEQLSTSGGYQFTPCHYCLHHFRMIKILLARWMSSCLTGVTYTIQIQLWFNGSNRCFASAEMLVMKNLMDRPFVTPTPVAFVWFCTPSILYHKATLPAYPVIVMMINHTEALNLNASRDFMPWSNDILQHILTYDIVNSLRPSDAYMRQ